MELSDFIPQYPDISSDDFYQQIYRKKEFYDLRAKQEPEEKTGPFFHHQEIVARFISHWTLYPSLFLIHDTGTGKSGSATAVFDGLIHYRPNLKTLYLSNNDTLLENFKTEILRRSPYLQQKWKALDSPPDANHFVGQRNRLLRECHLSFYTYSKFASLLLKGRTPFIKEFQNSLIILDEVHHLIVHELEKGKSTTTDYHEIHAFLHGIQHKKLLLMTATPMRNSPREIAPLLNLVLPLHQQLPISEAFENEYFTRNTQSILPSLEWKPSMEQRFQHTVKGYVSVVKKKVDVRVRYAGITYLPMKHFPLALHVMSTHQTNGYAAAFEKDTESAAGKKKVDASFYSRSVQASLMVFPDGSYGIKNTQKYIRQGNFSPLFWKESLLSQAKTPEEMLARIETMSTTYAHILRQILKKPNTLFYVYGDKINGSGIWACVLLLLRCFKFSLVKSARNFDWDRPARRCIFLNDTATKTTKTDIPRLIDTFNDPRNRFGDYIQVIFGTDKTREGITLKNIGSIHIVSPDWNFGKIYQAMGRGIRLLSHKDLGKDAEVTISFHCAVPSKDMSTSINLLNDMDSATPTEEEEEEEEAVPPPALLEADPDQEEEEEQEQDDDDNWLDDSDVEEQVEENSVVVSPRQLGQSIDYYKYIRSELRDYNIKLVEYALLTSAVDCQLNYANNVDPLGGDGSAACMYRPCDYRCEGIEETTPLALDTSTFNLYYVRPSVSRVMEMIRDYFQNTFVGHLTDLLEKGSRQGFTLQQVVETLHLMINLPVPLQSRDRRELFLAREGDTLFLLSDRNVLTWVHDKQWLSSYAKTPAFRTAMNFDELSHHMLEYRDIFVPYLESLVQHQTKESIAYYERIPSTIRDEIINVVLGVLDDPSTSSPECDAWIQWALANVFKGVIVQRKPYGWVYLLDKSPMKLVNGKLQFLETSAAQGQDQQQAQEQVMDTTTEDHEAPAFVKKYVTDNPFKKYGYLKDGHFKIRDVTKEKVKDEKSKTSGMACTSYRISERLSMLWKLGVRFPSAPPDSPTLSKVYDEINTSTSKSLFEKTEKNKITKKTWAEFQEMTKTTGAPSSEKQAKLYFFLYSLHFKGAELCDQLLEQFRAHNLLVKPPVK